MKTNRIIFMLALAAAATACNKAELEGTDPAGLKSNQFLASLEGASTKVTMADDFSLSWVAGDQVSVFGEDLKNNLFTADAAGEEVALNGGEVTVDPAATYYAIYPYSEKNSIVAGGVITTEIPTVQTPKQGDIPVNFAVARNDGQTFTFYNVCGLVGFEITEDNIVSVTVKANGAEEYLTGKINVTPSTAPSYEVVEGVSEVTLVTDGVFEKGYHYVAVLPQAFENGITVLMAKEDGTVAVKTTTKSFTLNRSHRIDTRQIDADQSWTKLTSISNAAELQAFLAAADNYAAADVVTLAADIDLKGYDIVPAVSFAGTFDGAGKSIKNWNTTTALFNEVSGTVKDLTIAESCNLEVQQQGNAAFIALANAGTISGCTNKGAVISVNSTYTSAAARMIGTIAAVSTGTVSDCVNDGTITLTPSSVNKAASQFVGGVVGQFSSSADVAGVDGCVNNAAVSVQVKNQHSGKLFVGGVCGGTPAGKLSTFGDYGIIKDCTNNGEVSVSANASSSQENYLNLGGVIGYAEADLNNCDNNAAVSATYPVEQGANTYAKRPSGGGVAGTAVANITDCDNTENGDVKVQGYFTGASLDTETKEIGVGTEKSYLTFGGITGSAGKNNTFTVSNCTNAGDIDLKIVTKIFTDDAAAKIHNVRIAVGGICGDSRAKISQCSTSGNHVYELAGSEAQDGFFGGVVGISRDELKTSSNTGNITAKDMSSVMFQIGGVVGKHNLATNGTFADNGSTSDIKILAGTTTSICYVGGLAGWSRGGILGTNSSNNPAVAKGSITISCSVPAYVGGLVGKNETGSLLDADVVDGYDISFSNPASGSRIGGVCGWKAVGVNDARIPVNANISVTSESALQDVYVGHWFGEISVMAGKSSMTLHTCAARGSINAPDVTAWGIVAGYLNATSTYPYSLGTSESKALSVRTVNEYNGNTLTAETYQDYLFGSVKSGATYNTTYCLFQ